MQKELFSINYPQLQDHAWPWNSWKFDRAPTEYYFFLEMNTCKKGTCKKGKRKIQGVPQSQTATLPRHQEEKETDKTKQAQIEQTYEKH